jgi:predicted TIM-barrel fold metal-dependent hydrolase
VLSAERGAVDCWIGFPTSEPIQMLDPLRAQLKDAESRSEGTSHVGFLFGAGIVHDEVDPVTTTLAAMDEHWIDVGLVQLITQAAHRAVREHPDRFRGLLHVDPNDTTGAVRAIRDAVVAPGICGVYLFPAGANPQVAVDDPRYYAIYQECVDHDLAVIVNAGVVGPRVPSWSQDVIRFDQVCYDFPDLRIVMCHGAEPDEALAVKLMLKWPGLHFMTSGFAPRHYPRAIVDYANSRGTEKGMYAGYYPYGLTLDRIFTELEDLPLRDHVWPAFLSDNARRVFKLS